MIVQIADFLDSRYLVMIVRIARMYQEMVRMAQVLTWGDRGAYGCCGTCD